MSDGLMTSVLCSPDVRINKYEERRCDVGSLGNSVAPDWLRLYETS